MRRKLHIRRAGQLDAGPMAELLNRLRTGTTVKGQEILSWMQRAGHAVWLVAEDEDGRLLGVQYAEPHGAPASSVARIASFVPGGREELQVGTALFDAMRHAARDAGYRRILAEIPEENAGGLIYYQSHGFEPYGRTGGTILMRYDL